jgi:AraC-like DNA-binding protein
MQLRPSPQLLPIVRHYLLLETAQEGSFQHRLLPDGSTGIVFYYGSSTPPQYFLGRKVARSFYYGPIRSFTDMCFTGHLHMLAVVLQPSGIHALTGIPAAVFRDQVVSLTDLWGRDAALLEEQVCQAGDPVQSIAAVEVFLTGRLQNIRPLHPLVAVAVQQLRLQQGTTGVQVLCRQLGIGERQLERLFRQYIGLSPKQFASLVKLQHTLKLLQNKTGTGQLTGITYAAGYYDQAHFIREFKKQAGMLPSQYLEQTQRLALNFIRFGQAGAPAV